MKYLFIVIAFIAGVSIVKAQSGKQDIPLNGAQEIALSASLSGVVIMASAEVSSIKINHVLTVNGEDRPDLKLLDVSREGDMIRITEQKPTADLINEEYNDVGMSVIHNAGDTWSYGHRGARVRAYLEVTIPANMIITAQTLYGSIEASGVRHMPAARSTYGVVEVIFAPDCQIDKLDFCSEYQSVDVALPADIAADISLNTSYGNMYSDFDYRVPASRQGIKKEGKLIGTINGGGVPISLTATYQNIYLRKL